MYLPEVQDEHDKERAIEMEARFEEAGHECAEVRELCQNRWDILNINLTVLKQ